LSTPPLRVRLNEPHPCFEETILKALALVVACVATGALLAGCASKPTNKDDSTFAYLLDRPSNWVENKVDTLPPLPTRIFFLSMSPATPRCSSRSIETR
jgi:hypothetical protein